MRHGIDGDEPEQVLLIHVVFNLDPVDLGALLLIFSGHACDNSIHLCPLKLIQAHIGPADGERLIRHLDDQIGIRRVETKEDIGQ